MRILLWIGMGIGIVLAVGLFDPNSILQIFATPEKLEQGSVNASELSPLAYGVDHQSTP